MAGNVRSTTKALRRRAERELKDRKNLCRPPPAQDALRLVHELEVHQIELEMQHEELHRASLEIESSMRRYAELFDLAPIGYVVLDTRGAIHEVNVEATRMLGVPRKQLAGSLFHPFLAEDHRQTFADLLHDVFAAALDGLQGHARDVVLATGADMRLIARARAGAEPRAMVAMHDVSARKRAEQALREESLRKDDFMATLSHELRNPLSPIRTSLAVLARAEPGGDEARAALTIAGRQLDHLVHIVDDLLDVTRIARGKIRLERELVELDALVRVLVEDHRRELRSRGIALEVRLERGLWVDADRTRIAQVVGNLLGNALKFTPRGGHVEVASCRDRDQVVLTVRDDGAGIAPGVREHLFQPFVQAPQTLDRTPGGLGLGLAMVKGLVELHGGSVDVYSAGVGRGAVFTVRLACAQAPVAATKARPSLVRTASAVARAGRRVLVIDDNADSADALGSLLELGGHEVRTAYDGVAALAVARDFRPDIVFCDIGLPEMDGYAVARAMRAEMAGGGAYLVALSGYARAEDRRRSVEAGFDDHLAKPAPIEAVERIVGQPR